MYVAGVSAGSTGLSRFAAVLVRKNENLWIHMSEKFLSSKAESFVEPELHLRDSKKGRELKHRVPSQNTDLYQILSCSSLC